MRELLRAPAGDTTRLIAAEVGVSTAPVAVQPLPRGSLGRRVGRRVRDWAPAVVVFMLVIALWEGLVRALDVQRFLLPPLSDILQSSGTTATRS